jgi:DNA-binding response OmpR family regulator
VRIKQVIKILVVDDDATVRSTMALLLERFHFDLSTADTAEKALDLMEEKPYDIIITDYNMPGMNGIELIRNVRSAPHRPAVILMTGCTDEAVLKHSGADMCLHKPFSAMILKDCIDRVILITSGENDRREQVPD